MPAWTLDVELQVHVMWPTAAAAGWNSDGQDRLGPTGPGMICYCKSVVNSRNVNALFAIVNIEKADVHLSLRHH